MSHTYYNRQWRDAQAMIGDILVSEVPPESAKPELDKVAAFQYVAGMYVKYVQIFRKLEQCYDQIVHPQKRRLLRTVLDGVMGRVLELKNEMVQLEFTDFNFFDDLISDFKLTPHEMEMPIPKYFILERKKALKEREKILGKILKRLGGQDSVDDTEDAMPVGDAVRLIQRHERARQGRARAKFMRDIREQEEKERLRALRGPPTKTPDEAAILIQKIWRGYSARRWTRNDRDQEMIFLGMMKPSPPDELGAPAHRMAKAAADRRRVQKAHEKEYQEALMSIKEKLKITEGPDIKETLIDQIRQWFLECRDALGKFPDYPDEDEGGSLMIFQEKSPQELKDELLAQDAQKGNKGKGGKKSDKKKDKKKDNKKDNKKDKGKKGKKKKGEEEPWFIQPSQFLPAIREANEDYHGVWGGRDESRNVGQTYDSELVRVEKRGEVEQEIRLQVDELMREELKNLKLAIDRVKEKKKKKKKGKKGKGKKGKKGKDLTPDRTIESLYEELVCEGIIVRHPRVSLTEYAGEFNFLGSQMRELKVEPLPTISDIRRVVTEYAILPLGSQRVHELAPLIKSMMLAGPEGVGKRMLLHAICTETGSNLFDLSAVNMAGKYPGKDGLKLLIHMVLKVGRALQPSVIYVGDCEKMYKKKIPKTDLSDPKRMKKQLPKALKTIKQDDRLLLIGTSNFPHEAKVKPLAKAYNKIVLIPRPDYGSRYIIWRELIEKNGGVITTALDLSSLAKITDGYTQSMMSAACSTVLNEERLHALQKQPLRAVEFVQPLSKFDPVTRIMDETYKNWYQKTPLGKKRQELLNPDDDPKKGKGKGGKGGKAGKKKGKKIQ